MCRGAGWCWWARDRAQNQRTGRLQGGMQLAGDAMLIDARAHVVWGCATARGSEYVADTIYFIYSDDEEGPLRRSDLNLFEGAGSTAATGVLAAISTLSLFRIRCSIGYFYRYMHTNSTHDSTHGDRTRTTTPNAVSTRCGNPRPCLEPPSLTRATCCPTTRVQILYRMCSTQLPNHAGSFTPPRSSDKSAVKASSAVGAILKSL